MQMHHPRLVRLRRASIALGAMSVLLLALPLAAHAAPAARWNLLGLTGPTVLPPLQSETQKVWVEAEGGTFELTATTAEGSGALSFGSGSAFSLGSTTALTVQAVTAGSFAPGQTLTGPGIQTEPPTIIEGVSNEGKTLALSQATTGISIGAVTGASREVQGVSADVGAFHPGDMISGPGIPAGTEVEAVNPDTLTLSSFATAAGTPALVATEVSAPIDFDAEASEVEARLDALPGLSVTVGGGPGDATASRPYLVSFGGGLADTNVARMAVDGAGLAGSSHNAAVATFVEGGPGTGEIAIYAQNLGGAASSGPVTVTLSLPAGISTTGTPTGRESAQWSCTPTGAGQETVSCESTKSTLPGFSLPALVAPIGVEAGAPPHSAAQIAISGGEGGTDSFELPIEVSPTRAKTGVQIFTAGAYDAQGELETTAAVHPAAASTAFFVNTFRSPLGSIVPVGEPKDIEVELPPGFIGNPLVVPRCPGSASISSDCSLNSVVGTAQPMLSRFGGSGLGFQAPVYDMEAPEGTPARFRFWEPLNQEVVNLIGSLRSDGDYGINVRSPNTPQLLNVYGAFLTFWGAPAAAVHDDQRCRSFPGGIGQTCAPSEIDEEAAFLTNPSDCQFEAASPPRANFLMSSWSEGSKIFGATEPLPAVGDCAALAFAPSFQFAPASREAAAPSAYTANLEMPQLGFAEFAKHAEPPLKKAVVTLPKGVNVNPSSANGLAACSEAQIGLTTTTGAQPNPIRFDKSQPSCPDASKLGVVQAKSPLLETTLGGTIYLAAQEANPFHSLLAVYLVLNDPKDGILVKLPGEVKPDPQTGQLTATFDSNPQLPVEDLKLNFRGGGPRSPLATPDVCGTYTTHGSWTPWSAPESGPPAQTTDSFNVTGAAGGGACPTSPAARPFGPSFEAGTASTSAGAYAPLVIKAARKDGEQELTRLEFTLPPGLTGRLAGIPYCADAAIAAAQGKSGRAELASPSCPGASELGSVDSAAGFGSAPIHVGGHVYLAGPYEGAPLSSVVITPAVAGPFDLGNVVVRAPLYVDPETAQITAKSDPIPTILKGIPLQLRSVQIVVDRHEFALNPTNCEPMAVSSSLSGGSGAVAKPTSHFQVGNCGALGFKPKLKIKLKGATKRIGHPALKAVLTARPGEAGIARAQVNLPHGEFLDQGNLNKTCTKPVLLAGNCPQSTIYGKAKAWTPLLEKPLEGSVYLVGGYGYKLPALVAELNGQIRVVLKGKVDSGPNKGIRNTFEAVPDAPVSRFVLEMKGGKKYGLLENSENLCKAKKAKRRAIVRFTGQNGKVKQFKPVVSNECGKHRKKTKKHKAHGGKKARQGGAHGRTR